MMTNQCRGGLAKRNPPKKVKKSAGYGANAAPNPPHVCLLSIPVVIRFVRTLLRHADVFGLLVAELGEHGVELFQIQARDLLVEVFRQRVDADRVFARVAFAPQFDLRDGLVGERRTHHVRGMARAAAQVHKAALCEQDDAFAVGEDHVIDLRLDLFPLVFFDGGDVDFVVEVADVANDGLVFHPGHEIVGDDVVIAGGGDEDVGLVGGVLHADDAITFHCGLQGADRIDLGDPNLRGERTQGLSGTLADVAVTRDHGDLAGDHLVGRALDAFQLRLAAAVEVVEFRFGDRVVDVDAVEFQLAARVHLIEAVHAGGGLFGDAADGREILRIPARLRGDALFDRGEQDAFFFAGRLAQYRRIFFRARAEVQQQGGVAAVVEDHVGGAAVMPFEDAVGVVPIFFDRFALNGEHRRAGRGDGGGGVVLRREDVARGPTHVGAERLQGLDQYRGLDGHVQGTGDARAFERLARGVFVADRHQTRQLGLGDADFLAAPGGEDQVGDNKVARGLNDSVHTYLLKTRAPFQGAAFLEPGGDPAAALLGESGDEDLNARRFAQGLGLVGALPGYVDVFAAEVAV